MALQKSFTHKGERKANSYWRISSVSVTNNHTPHAMILLSGYASKTTRDANPTSNAIAHINMRIPGDHKDKTWSDFYVLIKKYKEGQEPEDGEEDEREQPFLGAEDV